MKKFLILFASSFLLFAQEPDVLPALETPPIEDSVELVEVENVDTAAVADTVDIAVADSVITETAVKNVARTHNVLFMGVQSGEIPEIRETFENMIRTKFGRESNVAFIGKDVSTRISKTLFLGRKTVIDSVFFAELEKRKLQNSIVLLIEIDEYYIKAVRKYGVLGAIEGKLRVNYLFYDAAVKKELFFANVASTAVEKKGLIFWHSPQTKIPVGAFDVKRINEKLLGDIVEQGFGMLEFAISLRK